MDKVKKTLKYLKERGLRDTVLKVLSELGGPFQKFILVDYYGDIENRVRSYHGRFGEKSKKAALRMVWWNFKQLLKFHVEKPLIECGNQNSYEERDRHRHKFELSDNQLNIAFRIDGGFGDFLIFANYLWYFRKKYPNPDIRVDIFFVKGLGYSKLLFQGNEVCNHCYQYEEDEECCRAYDLYFSLSRFPRVCEFDARRILDFCPELIDYILLCEQFYDENRRFFDRLPECDGQCAFFSIYKGQTRLQEPDIYNFLGIEKEYSYSLPQCSDKCLDRLGLRNKHYVTLHYGCDMAYDKATKMWPHRFYCELAKLIKEEFPEVIIVQYGVNEKRCPPMSNIDLNIVGKTSMEDVSVLLQHCLLHVDCDGGMLHFRHAIHGGPSVGLYGPLRADFFGYDENISLTGDGCGDCCEWLTGNWMAECARGYAEPPCMVSITPEKVMNAVRKILQKEIRS